MRDRISGVLIESTQERETDGAIVEYRDSAELRALQDGVARRAADAQWRADWAAAWNAIAWMASVESAINTSGALLNALADRHAVNTTILRNMGVDVKKLLRNAKRKGKR